MKSLQVRSQSRWLAGWLTVLACMIGMIPVVVADEAKTGAAAAKPTIDSTHPLYRPLEMAYESRQALDNVKDYQAVFVKRELIGRKVQTSTMNLKLREEPFSVYLLFKDPNKGREVIFVNGKYKNQLQVHETGIKAVVGTVSLDPKGDMAMDGNKYPVTMIGMRKMLEKIIAQWEEEGKYGETTVLFYDPKDTKLGDRPCAAIEASHPQPRSQFKFQKTLLFLDAETNLPIGVQQYGFPGKRDKQSPLVEEYTYGQLKLNANLTDRDFDTTNPAYAYPK